MTRLQPILTLFVILVLALTQGAAAGTRINRLGAMEVVICTGHGGMQTLWLDAQGQPVAPPHDCPDCLPALLATLPDAGGTVVAPQRNRPAPATAHAVAAPRALTFAPHARAPPVLS